MHSKSPSLDIREEIKHTVVDQLKIIRQIVRMPEEDIALIRQVDSKINDSPVAATKGTLAFLEKIGDHRKNLVTLLGNAIHPDSPQYEKATRRLIGLMNKATKISDEDMKLPIKDGVPQFDESIWGWRTLKSETAKIHATIEHFMQQTLYKTVENDWEKDGLLAAMADAAIIDKLKHPDKPSPIFDLWRKKKANGGLGWISDKRFQAFEKVFNK